MRRFRHSRHLPIIFRSLDIEERTKPVPYVLCPKRGDLMTASACGRCLDFHRIDFDHESVPMLTCVGEVAQDGVGQRGRAAAARANDEPLRMHDVLRMPAICAAHDSPVSSLRPYLALGSARDVVPVLDARARPVGLVTFAQLRARTDLLEDEIPLARIMCPHPPLVVLDTSVTDAARLLAGSESGRLFVVDHDGTLLGVVTAAELCAADTDAPH